MDKLIWQLAITRRDNTCPVCGRTVTERKPYTIAITYPDHRTAPYKCDVLYCSNCNIPLADVYAGKQVLDSTGAWINFFVPNKKCSVISIQNQMYYRKKKPALTTYESNQDLPLELVGSGHSSKGLTANDHKPLNATQKEKERRQKADMREFCLAKRRKLKEVIGAVVMICARFQGRPLEEFIITNRKELHDGKMVFHYTSSEALELLSAAFAKERSRKGILYDNNFKVKATVFTAQKTQKALERLRPMELEIRAGGGYYSLTMSRREELVDVLLYSPFSQRYELLRATHNKELDCCYCDVGLYRKFIHEHGNPGVKLFFNGGASYAGDDFNLRPESILKGYGYSVAQADQLSTAERQNILSEIIDLGILEIPVIINYLDFFCRSHSTDKDFYARLRWTEDRKFVENYKANPDRFLIAQVNSKKGQ